MAKKDDFCKKMVEDAGEGVKLGKCEVDTSRNLQTEESGNVKLVIILVFPIDKLPENVVSVLTEIITKVSADVGILVLNIDVINCFLAPKTKCSHLANVDMWIFLGGWVMNLFHSHSKGLYKHPHDSRNHPE